MRPAIVFSLQRPFREKQNQDFTIAWLSRITLAAPQSDYVVIVTKRGVFKKSNDLNRRPVALLGRVAEFKFHFLRCGPVL